MTSELPAGCTLVRAPNPGPMTLDGTNTWLLAAGDGVVVVDPGPLDAAHLARVAAHGPVLLTVLTHGHPDHAEGAERFAALTGSPVRARDPRLCRNADPLDRDGADLAVGGLAVTVLHTPGHTGDSICLLLRDGAGAATAVLTGDTVLGRGTTVVAHPDGRLDDYLASLRRLADLGAVPVLPGHGPVLPSAAQVATRYLAHREQRLTEVRGALAAGACSPAEVVAAVYADIDPAVRPAAELSARAQLDYLATHDSP